VKAATTVLLPIGDPNGIGPEIAVKAALALGAGLPRILLVADPHVIDHYRGNDSVRIIEPGRPPPPAPHTIDVVPVDGISPADFAPGRCNAASGRATIAYVQAALDAGRAGGAQAIVACPHNERAVNSAGISFSGYPSLLARLSGLPEERVFLMLVGAGLRITHATLHERLQNALARLNTDLIVAAGMAAHDSLRLLGISTPRIGLFGINPHAGEDGLFGDDDARITVPAVAALSARGIDAVGPTGADLLLAERGCDGYVAMFHDQGHIPIKLLAGRNSTAFSVGAGVLFASVGHGSAPDIAGQGKADPSPLINAVNLAANTIQPQLAYQHPE
jgi:4-hydroxy-L-threonine phosphate dehydrogenase PdxA